MIRPSLCDGCRLNPTSSNYVGSGLAGEFVPWHPILPDRLIPPRITQRVVIVGIAPGEAEERLGEPFVGPSGRVLHSVLRWAQIDASDVFKTNLVMCRTLRTGITKVVNRDPLKPEVNDCASRWLWPMLNAWAQRVPTGWLVPLGALPFRHLMEAGLSEATFGKARGNRHKVKGPYAVTAPVRPRRVSPKGQPGRAKVRLCRCGSGLVLEARKRKCPKCRK